MQYQKVKSVGKDVLVRGPKLEKIVLETMQKVSDLVGATLGPGGHPVLLEHQEPNMPNMVTKDGVTVFKSIGFMDPAAHCIMEAARDASIRTATEAGDGTTTATILANAIVRRMSDYCKTNPHISPQKIIRVLQTAFKEVIEPEIRKFSMPCDTIELRRNVAKLSANGDVELADAVMKCFEIVGDEGNVTISEVSGPSRYEVEQIEGYPINIGYDDSCMNFYPKFLNDPVSQRCILPDPIFVLYHGQISDIGAVQFVLEKIGMDWQAEGTAHNVVLVSTGFSASVIALLAQNFAAPEFINVFPLVAPRNALPNSQLDFLLDISAITGARVFDVLNNPLPRTHDAVDVKNFGYGVKFFEAFRYRSTIIGQCDELLVLERVDALSKQLKQTPSMLETDYINERIGKLTGGIAKLKVVGSSNGELRERRDRAEDAVMAVRKAIEHGCLPGGGWMLTRLARNLTGERNTKELKPAWDPPPLSVLLPRYQQDDTTQNVYDKILIPALLEPFYVLFRNLGYTDEETSSEFLSKYMEHPYTSMQVYDGMDGHWVKAVEGGILDSTPAVLEAIRNSLSIAALLGTLGGAVVFYRDQASERQEARDTQEFLRNANVNEADERA